MLRSLFILCCLLLASAAHANDEAIRCAVFGDPPWFIEHTEGLKGVAPYYAKKFGNSSGTEILLDPMPYKRSVKSINDSSYDFVLALPSEELKRAAEPYVSIGRVALVLYSKIPIEELRDRHDHDVTIAVLSGTEENTQNWTNAKWKTVIVNGEIDALRAVAKGHFDATLVTRNAYDYLISQEPNIAQGHTENRGTAPVYAWINRKNTEKARFTDAKAKIEKASFNGKLVLDWYTASLADARNNRE